jgi:hypothetical protein
MTQAGSNGQKSIKIKLLHAVLMTTFFSSLFSKFMRDHIFAEETV